MRGFAEGRVGWQREKTEGWGHAHGLGGADLGCSWRMYSRVLAVEGEGCSAWCSTGSRSCGCCGIMGCLGSDPCALRLEGCRGSLGFLDVEKAERAREAK